MTTFTLVYYPICAGVATSIFIDMQVRTEKAAIKAASKYGKFTLIEKAWNIDGIRFASKETTYINYNGILEVY